MMGGAGAVGAFSIFLAACGDDDEETTGSGGDTGTGTGTETGSTQADNGDVEIVNYALTLEHLENDFYKAVLESGAITDKTIGELATEVQMNEQEHVDALTATVKQLGGTPAPQPTTKFEDVISGGPDMILKTAAEVENLGAAAYLGQAGKIKSPEILAAALSIHSVEARHAAALNTLIGKSVTPDGAFAKPASMDKVLKAVKPFIAS
jgi:rubrerythrin